MEPAYLVGFLRENINTILIILCLSVLALVVTFSWRHLREKKASNASQALYEVHKTAENSPERKTALLNFINEYKGVSAANEARMELGKYYFKAGSFADALEQFTALAKTNDDILSVAALYMVAETKRAMGKIEDAAEDYKALANNSKNINKDESEYQAARCYEDLKKYDEAQKIYRELVKNSSDDNLKSLSEERLLWLISSGVISG